MGDRTWDNPSHPLTPIYPARPPETPRKLFLVQEFCNGGSLRQAVDARTIFWDSEAKQPRMVRAQARARVCLHQRPAPVMRPRARLAWARVTHRSKPHSSAR
jgi:hypothetical protein